MASWATPAASTASTAIAVDEAMRAALRRSGSGTSRRASIARSANSAITSAAAATTAVGKTPKRAKPGKTTSAPSESVPPPNGRCSAPAEAATSAAQSRAGSGRSPCGTVAGRTAANASPATAAIDGAIQSQAGPRDSGADMSHDPTVRMGRALR
jgi:hypothetical protein